MVGRLVEQQDVGRRRQRAGEGRTACLAAGQGGGMFVAGQAELLQQVARAMVVGVSVGDQPGLDIGERGGEAGQLGFLREVADGGARAAAGALEQFHADWNRRPHLSLREAQRRSNPLPPG